MAVNDKTRLALFAAVTFTGTLLISLAISELATRLFAPSWLEYRMVELNVGQQREFSDRNWPTERVGGVLKNFLPHSGFRTTHYEYDTAVSIDELGGRVTQHRGGERHIPFLGDSFLFGVGVEDDETYIHHLASASQNSEDRFLNLGVPGSALHRQLDIVELRHEELGRPGLYVFNVFLGNDFTGIFGYFTEQEESQKASSVAAGKPDRAKRPKKKTLSHNLNAFVFHNPVLKRSYLIQLVRQKLLSVLNRNNRKVMH